MKINTASCYAMLILVLFSCIPERENMQPKEIKLIADKTEAKTGETVEVSFLNLFNPSNRYILWTVVPGNGVALDSVYSRVGNSIKFNKQGTYTILADVRSVSVYCFPTPAQDSCFKASNQKIPLQVTVVVKN